MDGPADRGSCKPDCGAIRNKLVDSKSSVHGP